MPHRVIYSLVYPDWVLAIIIYVQALFASQIEHDKNPHLPADDKWSLYRGAQIGTHWAMDSKSPVGEYVAMRCTESIIVISRVNAAVKYQSWCLSEINVTFDVSGRK